MLKQTPWDQKLFLNPDTASKLYYELSSSRRWIEGGNGTISHPFKNFFRMLIGLKPIRRHRSRKGSWYPRGYISLRIDGETINFFGLRSDAQVLARVKEILEWVNEDRFGNQLLEAKHG